jgi:hypothetical protein
VVADSVIDHAFGTSWQREIDGKVVRAPDRLHFCPTGFHRTTPCPVASDGASRYGRALAQAATS